MTPHSPPDRDRADGDPVRARAREVLAAHPWPADLLAALARIGAGGRALVVGGSVRDVLLGRPSGGVWDVATDIRPDEVSRRFERVEPTGLAHGTVLILEGDLRIDCTTFRREGAYPDARHPESVAYTDDPIEDLGRRDLTINAMAWDPLRSELLDPHGGAHDLERRVLRAVGDARARFHEDGLRPLRVARFAAVLEFEPEPETRAALGSSLDRAAQVSWERVRTELDRMLEARAPSSGFRLLREAGLLALWLPELDRCHGVAQNRFHAWDVFEHSLRACDAVPAENRRVRWAALLHDVGKPGTRVERRGDFTFYDHEQLGAELADQALARLRFSSDERRAIVHLVRQHMFDYRPEWSDAAVRRWLRRVSLAAVDDLFALRLADDAAHGVRAAERDPLSGMRERVARERAAARALGISDLAVGGADVMRVLGVPPGPEVGRALEALLDRVIESPETNRRDRLIELLERARRER